MTSQTFAPAQARPITIALRQSRTAPSPRLPLLLRLSFLLFVFAIPIEALNLSLNLGRISLARMSGLLFFAMTLVHFRKCYANFPPGLCWFVVYVVIYVINGAFIETVYRSLFVTHLMSLIQLIVLFWTGSNLLKAERFCRTVLTTYAMATLFLGLAVMFGISGFSRDVLAGPGGDRLVAMGINPNGLGLSFAVAGAILTGLALEKNLRRLVLVVPLLVLLVVMIQTGSRASVLGYVVGTLCYLLPFAVSRRKTIAVIGAGFALGILTYVVLQNPDFIERVRLTAEGDSAGRDHILRNTVAMMSERPFVGWGPIAYQYELMRRERGFVDLRFPQDPHNVALGVLIEVGILGGVPFFMAVGACAGNAWRNRTTGLGILPFSVFVTVAAVMQFHAFIAAKAMWLVLTACAAAKARGPVNDTKLVQISRR